MGQATRRLCHTQEIAYEPALDEWRPIDEWSQDMTENETCEKMPLACRVCCKPSESQVEEVIVVHHEALQRVDFLLRYDELAACESPALPECVSAVRRSKIQKRLQTHGSRPASQVKDGGTGPLRLPDVAHQEGLEDNDPSITSDGEHDGEDETSAGYTHSPQDLSAEMMHRVQAERKMLANFVRRMHDGMAMTMLEVGNAPKKIVLRLPPENPQVLLIEKNAGGMETIPLSCVSCIHIGCRDHIFEAAGKLPSMCMVLTAALPSKEQGELDADTQAVGEPTGKMHTYHLTFESQDDAEEFKKGMKRFRDQRFLGEAGNGA